MFVKFFIVRYSRRRLSLTCVNEQLIPRLARYVNIDRSLSADNEASRSTSYTVDLSLKNSTITSGVSGSVTFLVIVISSMFYIMYIR